MNVALNIELSDPLVRLTLLVLKQAAMDVVDGYVHRHSAGERSALAFLVAANLAHRATALAELHPSAITSCATLKAPKERTKKPMPAEFSPPRGVTWTSSGSWRVYVDATCRRSFPGTSAGLAAAIELRQSGLDRMRA